MRNTWHTSSRISACSIISIAEDHQVSTEQRSWRSFPMNALGSVREQNVKFWCQILTYNRQPQLSSHAHQVPWLCDVTRCFVYSYFVDTFSAVLFSCGVCTNKSKPPLSGVNHPLTYPPWKFDKEWPLCVMWVLSCYVFPLLVGQPGCWFVWPHLASFAWVLLCD